MNLDIDLRRAGRAVKTFWPVLLAVFAAGFLVLFLKERLEPPVFTASASFIASAGVKESASAPAPTLNSEAVGTCAGLLESRSVLAEAASRAGSKLLPVQIQPMLQVKISADSDLVELTVTSRDGKTAAALADALIDTLAGRQIELTPSVPILVSPVDRAVYVPEKTSVSSTLKTGLLGGLVGFVLAAVVIFLASALSGRVRLPEELEAVSGLPFLGALPRKDSAAEAAELKTLLRGRLSGPAVAVVSPSKSVRGSAPAEAVAGALLSSGFKTLLVKRGANLPGVTVGFDSPAAVSALEALKKEYDYIVIDSAAPAAAALAGNAVLALGYGETRLSEAVSLIKKLSLAGAAVAGFMIFAVPEKDMALFD